jgi:hypothetical protein
MIKSNRLHEAVARAVSETKARCSDGKVTISYQPYESEDAHLIVHPPEDWSLDQCWTLGEEMAAFCSDLFERTSIFVLVLVIDPPDKVKQANAEFAEHIARQRAS